MNTKRHLSVLSLFVLFLIWNIITYKQWISPVLLPSPLQIIKKGELIILYGYGGIGFWANLWATAGRLAIATLLVLVTAVPLAIAMGYFGVVRAIFEPFIEFYRPLPPLAYLPLFIFWFGIGALSKILLLFFLGLPIIIVPTVRAIQDVKPERLYSAMSLGATQKQLLFYVIVPSILPDLMSSIRTSILFMFTALVAAELEGATEGIGWMIWRASQFFQTDVVIFGIVCLSVIGVLIERLLGYLQTQITPWVGKE